MKNGRVLRTKPLIALVFVLLISVLASSSVFGAIKIYVDTSAIQARTDMTQAQKDAVINQMKSTIKENLEEAFGAGNVTVTNNASDKDSADRSVKVDGSTNKPDTWGEWPHGSSGATVYLKSYLSESEFKSGSTYDTTKLGTALGTTAAHEIAHSFSAVHDDTNTNKMSTANNASELGGGLNFNDPAKKKLQKNQNKPPCNPSKKSTKSKSLQCSFYDDPILAIDEKYNDEAAVTCTFNFGGPMADMFDFGWWGADTDNGAIDGEMWNDFIYKSTMGEPPFDAPSMTFFDGYCCNFVLYGQPGTPYDGLYFDIEDADVVLSNPVTRPDMTVAYQTISLAWDVDADSFFDVFVDMDTDYFGPDSPQYSGFIFDFTPPMTIAEQKFQCDGYYADLETAVVTYSEAPFFYVQHEFAPQGIRVMDTTGPAPAVGDMVELSGKVATNPMEERYVIARDVMPLGPGAPIRPVGMMNRAVGGGDWNYVPGLWPNGQKGVTGSAGLNNIGLLIKTWGQVLATGPDFIEISDGHNFPIRVEVPPTVIIDPAWTFVSVTGVCSVENTGTDLVPVVLVRTQDDIVPH